MTEAEKWIRERFEKQGEITTWHWNDDVLVYCDKFLPSKASVRVGQRAIARVMRKLVKEGKAFAYWGGIGAGGRSEFGTGRQRNWFAKKF